MILGTWTYLEWLEHLPILNSKFWRIDFYMYLSSILVVVWNWNGKSFKSSTWLRCDIFLDTVYDTNPGKATLRNPIQLETQLLHILKSEVLEWLE